MVAVSEVVNVILVDIKVSGAHLLMELVDVLLQRLGMWCLCRKLDGVPYLLPWHCCWCHICMAQAPWLSCDFMGKF